MKEIDAKLWRNRQIMFPPEVEHALGIIPGEKVRFVIHDDGRVEVVKAEEKSNVNGNNHNQDPEPAAVV